MVRPIRCTLVVMKEAQRLATTCPRATNVWYKSLDYASLGDPVHLWAFISLFFSFSLLSGKRKANVEELKRRVGAWSALVHL